MKRKRQMKNAAVSGMSVADADLLLKALTAKYGTTFPAVNPVARIRAVEPKNQPDLEHEDKNAKVNWKKERHTCPRCNHEGPVDPDFGTRTVRGNTMKQSYCGTCRAGLNYYAKPRKNRSNT